MKLENRIKKLEKLTPTPAGNPYADWTDEELDKSIELLAMEISTGQKQVWPEELARKRATLPRMPSELDELSDEELDARIAVLAKKIGIEGIVPGLGK